MGEEGGKDNFQKNQSIKPYIGESVPTLLSEIVVFKKAPGRFDRAPGVDIRSS